MTQLVAIIGVLLYWQSNGGRLRAERAEKTDPGGLTAYPQGFVVKVSALSPLPQNFEVNMKLLTQREKALEVLSKYPADTDGGRLRTLSRLICDSCGEDVDAVVMCGEPLAYESATACICKSCAAQIMGLFK